MPYVENDGVRIHYEVEGKGPSLVLQHGFTHSLRRWYLHGYVDALRNDYELVLIDARGHGESDKPHDPHAYTLAARVRDVVAVVDDLKRRAVMFWGWSAGGRIGFGLAQYAPQRITAFVIGGGDPYERRLPESSRIAGADPEAFLTAFFARLKIDPATVPSVVREELMKNDFRALAAAQQDEPSVENVLPRMTVPSLLYCGDADPHYPHVQKCAQTMPNAKFFTLHGLDHGATFREAGLVLPNVITFLQAATKASAQPV